MLVLTADHRRAAVREGLAPGVERRRPRHRTGSAVGPQRRASARLPTRRSDRRQRVRRPRSARRTSRTGPALTSRACSRTRSATRGPARRRVPWSYALAGRRGRRSRRHLVRASGRQACTGARARSGGRATVFDIVRALLARALPAAVTRAAASIEAHFDCEGFEHIDAAHRGGPGHDPRPAAPRRLRLRRRLARDARRTAPLVVVEPVEPPELFEWFAATRRRSGWRWSPLGRRRRGRRAAGAAREPGRVPPVRPRPRRRRRRGRVLRRARRRCPAGPATLALRTGRHAAARRRVSSRPAAGTSGRILAAARHAAHGPVPRATSRGSPAELARPVRGARSAPPPSSGT